MGSAGRWVASPSCRFDSPSPSRSCSPSSPRRRAPSKPATADLYGPSFKYCGSFKAKSLAIHVYAKKITCRKARSIEREYWLGPRSRKIYVNGGFGADGYIKLKRFRGWKCTSGSGGGSCNKRRSSAAYAN